MNEDIESTIREYIQTNITKRRKLQIGRDDPLISTGLIDSFHLVDLATFIEDQFGVRIEDTELNADAFDSIGQLVDLIIGKPRS